MKTDIKSLKDSFEAWYDINYKSRKEVSEVLDMYHNRQWSREQIVVLEGRGQPKETFNIIKLFTRVLLGHYSTVVNRAVIEPKNYSDITKAALLNDALQASYEDNNFDIKDDDIKTYGFLSGLFVSYTKVTPTGKKDMFGRNELFIDISEVNPEEVVIDPLSSKRDYSDARGIHRFKWLDEETLKSTFGKNQKTIDKLDSYFNHLNIDEAEFTYKFDQEFMGRYNIDDMYLVVHSVMRNDKGQLESIFWCGETELARTVINLPNGMMPYTVTKVVNSNKEEFYGIFHEVIESQKAVNQAIIQIQLLVNSNKVFVETDAVDDVDEFADVVARVNAVVEVLNLNGVKIENLSQDVVSQYTIIDNAFARIKQVLGINDYMLGASFAADSGRKVKLQKNASANTLRYITAPLELFHKRQANLTARLIIEYFSSYQILRVTDEINGNRFIELNKPVLLPKLPPQLARLVAQGMDISYAFEAMLTGQLNPAVMQAMQADQMAQQQQQQFQMAQQQAMLQTEQMRQQVLARGLSPQNLEPVQPMVPPPPPANNMQQLPGVNNDKLVESTPRVQATSQISTTADLAEAPEGFEFLFEEMIDPMTGEPMRDKAGNILVEPVNQPDTVLDIEEFQVVIKPSSYDDEDEKAQLLMELMLNGPAGQFAMQASPAHYAKMVSLNVQSMKTKYSPEIAQMFNEMAMSMGQNPEFQAYMRTVTSGVNPQQAEGVTDDGNGGWIPNGGMTGNGPGSSELKLPTNTNEGF